MPRKILILLNAASPRVSPVLAEACAMAGLEPHLALDLPQAARMAFELRPTLICFDQQPWTTALQDSLWQINRLQNIRSSRKLILATGATLDDCVLALEAGADDFILNPVSARELHARIKALLRSQDALSHEDDPVRCGTLQLHREGMEVEIQHRGAEQRSKLSPREFSLLAYFMDRPGHVLSRDELLENLWYPVGEIEDRRVVDVYIWRLREKIEDDPTRPSRLLTRRGEGYCLVEPKA
ncbi:two-component system, OmpR family, alkaline phosphatase synthesis response regulator PhoP/two-component system, OmpR family, response regulator VicR [Granulicella rosea]|uniref:Two-component system, OmpR family, alkaline phosphatase synthesis response regulator PhoP/two-component system, OmpR family, response regulator VicR n=1 Tax=Granulicella rosea TaxID=474952 RepID=A0A239M3S2_9BACT|nr:winged helix-turn-helix domain-containing protein [Granulicella rosea]SNT36763.1 two-component system, OmpR family, alkaline phosphatase synthesis response regulator PhoP/two-component system, OmpR family, response regulator VicR [Granulicella rosea]